MLPFTLLAGLLLPASEQVRSLPSFVPISGVRELSARLIVRPLQRETLTAGGLSLEEAWERRSAAKRALLRYPVLRYVPQTDEYVLALGSAALAEPAAAQLAESGLFQYVEPDWLLFPCASASSAQTQGGPAQQRAPQIVPTCPNDFDLPSQWHFQPGIMDGCSGWSLSTGSPAIHIGLCDTGVLLNHQDLLLHRLEGYNAVDQLWESQGGLVGPVMNHGTRTTGVAAANGNNSLGVSGVCWNVSHRMLRVSNASNGGAYLSDLQHGARTSIESGDRVVNVSYAGVQSLSNLATASYIKSIGGLLVWAAGNDGGTLSQSDRDADDLLVVGASDMGNGLASFSNSGTFIDLVAPGVNISTTDSANDHAYTQTASGTSYAAPLVTGLCALIWSRQPTLSPNDVERLLKLGAEDFGAPGLDDVFGHGRADMYASLALDASAVPQAQLAAYPTSGSSPLEVHFTDLSTGAPTSWLWDFGDGSTSTLQNPAHIYASLGSYTVTLSVGNALGVDIAARPNYVLVDVVPPVAEFSAVPTSGLSPLPVAFSDLSRGGTPTAWLWDFGDGTSSTLQNPIHVYTSPGTFNVTLTASNAYGSDPLTKYGCVTVDYIPPVADFSGTPTSGNSPMVVHFTDLSSGGVATSWSWYFGDGGFSALQNPAHTYTQPGTYTVRLIAANAYGSNERTRIAYIQVGAGPPILADFEGTPTAGNAPLQVQFTDLSVGNIAGWEWDFGDGSTSTLQNPTHVYTVPGDYDVSLQVFNADGIDDQLDKLQYVIVD